LDVFWYGEKNELVVFQLYIIISTRYLWTMNYENFFVSKTFKIIGRYLTSTHNQLDSSIKLSLFYKEYKWFVQLPSNGLHDWSVTSGAIAIVK